MDDRCFAGAKKMAVYITEGVLINQAPISYLQFEAQSRMDGNKSGFFFSLYPFEVYVSVAQRLACLSTVKR